MLQTIDKLRFKDGRWDCSGIQNDQLRPDYFGSLKSIRQSMKAKSEKLALVACSDHQGTLLNISGVPSRRVILIQNLCSTLNTLNDDQSSCGFEIYLETESIRHLVICGHRHCGFMRHWLTKHRMMRPNAEDVSAAVEAYIKLQLGLAATSTAIHKHLQEGLLKLHGWMVDEATAQVAIFNPISSEFESQLSAGQ